MSAVPWNRTFVCAKRPETLTLPRQRQDVVRLGWLHSMPGQTNRQPSSSTGPSPSRRRTRSQTGKIRRFRRLLYRTVAALAWRWTTVVLVASMALQKRGSCPELWEAYNALDASGYCAPGSDPVRPAANERLESRTTSLHERTTSLASRQSPRRELDVPRRQPAQAKRDRYLPALRSL